MALSKHDHLAAAHGPKRILSLDGGGLRGILTLEYLAVIEAALARRSGGARFRLCDYFDLIGGTSTGAIIAAGLACGMTVADIGAMYRGLGKSVFKSSLLRHGLLAAKFPADKVREALDGALGSDVTLGDKRVLTGLMVMTKRMDTGSPWPVHNHPDARYAKQDGALLLSQLVRASTAAPTYFDPERIRISTRDGQVTDGVFVDGGVTPFNDPALQMLMLASLQGHGFRWTPGADRLLLVSVGTGTAPRAIDAKKLMRMPPVEQGLRSLQSLMEDCGRTNHAMLQWLTHNLTPWHIDRAVGDMAPDSANGPKLASYVRYNVRFEQKWLKDELGLDFDDKQLADLAAMDKPKKMDALAALGAQAARHQFSEAHLPKGFDV